MFVLNHLCSYCDCQVWVCVRPGTVPTRRFVAGIEHVPAACGHCRAPTTARAGVPTPRDRTPPPPPRGGTFVRVAPARASLEASVRPALSPTRVAPAYGPRGDRTDTRRRELRTSTSPARGLRASPLSPRVARVYAPRSDHTATRRRDRRITSARLRHGYGARVAPRVWPAKGGAVKGRGVEDTGDEPPSGWGGCPPPGAASTRPDPREGPVPERTGTGPSSVRSPPGG